jgi:hypothetical protein
MFAFVKIFVVPSHRLNINKSQPSPMDTNKPLESAKDIAEEALYKTINDNSGDELEVFSEKIKAYARRKCLEQQAIARTHLSDVGEKDFLFQRQQMPFPNFE